jgi:hypothetical protein
MPDRIERDADYSPEFDPRAVLEQLAHASELEEMTPDGIRGRMESLGCREADQVRESGLGLLYGRPEVPTTVTLLIRDGRRDQVVTLSVGIRGEYRLQTNIADVGREEIKPDDLHQLAGVIAIRGTSLQRTVGYAFGTGPRFEAWLQGQMAGNDILREEAEQIRKQILDGGAL